MDNKNHKEGLMSLLSKALIALFWIANNGLLFWAGIDSSKGFVYHLLNDIVFQVFLVIGILGLSSIILEKFYKNVIYKYFILSFFLLSSWFFLRISVIFFGIVDDANYKGIDMTFDKLLFHYSINVALFCLILCGVYGLFRNKRKMTILGFCVALLYIFLCIFFYIHLRWGSPIKEYKDFEAFQNDLKQESLQTQVQDMQEQTDSDILPIIDTEEKVSVLPLKELENFFYMYKYTTQYAHLNDEELKEYFDDEFIPFTHTLPKVGTTIKYKGNLRISWSFDVKHNKNIDLIFFPEENPYINYAVLYAKDFPKKFNKNIYARTDRDLSNVEIPPHINDDFVKEVLAQSNLSKTQQEQFFQSRFGSVFVPMEIEFEWYYQPEETPFRAAYGKYLAWPPLIGVIQSFEVLPPDTPLGYPPFIECYQLGRTRALPYPKLFTPLPTAAIAYTQTKPNDFIVNVRDKPDSKGKIVTQLLTQEIKIPDNFCLAYSDHGDCYDVNPLYEKMVSQGYEWYYKDNENSSTDNEGYFRYYQWKTQQAYYKKEKPKLINPLDYKDYLILVWNIEPNEWAKVWILKMINDKDYIILEGYNSGEKEKRYFENTDIIRNGEYIDFDESYLYLFLDESSYTQTFLESPSVLKLYEGYIHTNSLQYLAPFGQSYIKIGE